MAGTTLIAESAARTGLLFREERDTIAGFCISGMTGAGIVAGVTKEVVGVSASKAIEILNPTSPPAFLNAAYQLTGWSVAGVLFFGVFPNLIRTQISKFDQIRKQAR